MVIQTLQSKPKILKELQDEINILTSLGVEDYEIKYLVYIKTKKLWENEDEN